MNIFSVSPLLVERLGWLLIHSLWQFTLIALIAALAIQLLRHNSATVRYGVLAAAMMMSFLTPAATWLLQAGSSSNTLRATPPSQLVQSLEPLAEIEFDLEPDAFTTIHGTPAGNLEIPFADFVADYDEPDASWETPSAIASATGLHSENALSWSEQSRRFLQPWLAWIVAAWCVGVVLCAFRPLLGWYTLQRLRRVGISTVPDDILATAHRVSEKLGMHRAVRVLHSTLAEVPVVVGYVRPIILLPLSLVTTIPTSQLEAILAHELAHVRRHDFLVNLVQTLVETVFFYHPAIWWLSRHLRQEREHCCDDLVVTLFNNRVDYGRALLAIEEQRGHGTVLALRATDGSLLSRVRRITGVSPDRTAVRLSDRWPVASVGVMTLALLLMIAVSSLVASRAKDLPISSNELRRDPLLAELPHGIKVELVGRGSPDPALDPKAGLAALEKETSETNNENGDLRSNPAPGLGEPRRAQDKQAGPRTLLKSAFLLPGHNNMMDVRFDNNDTELVAVSAYHFATVRRCDVIERKLKSEITLASDQHHRPFRQAFQLSGDGRCVVAATDEFVGIWDTSTGQLLKKLTFPTKHSIYDCWIDKLDCTPDLSVIAGHWATPGRLTLAYDAHVMIWDAASGKLLRTVIDKHATVLQSIDLSTNGKLLATTNGAGAKVWETSTGELLHTFSNDNKGRKHSDPEVKGQYNNHVWSVQLSPDAKQIAVGDILGVKLWDIDSGKLQHQLDAPYRYSHHRAQLVYSKDGQLLARTSTSGKVLGKVVPIWSTQTGEKRFELHTESQCGAFSDDSKQFAVGLSGNKMALGVFQLSGNAVVPKQADQPPKASNDSGTGGRRYHHRGKKAEEFIGKWKPVWGEAQQGIRYGIAMTTEQRQFRVGQRVPMAIFFRNVSDKPLRVDVRPDFFWDTPKVTDVNGAEVKLEKIALLGNAPHYREKLQPGEAFGAIYLSIGVGENPRPGQQDWAPYWKAPVPGHIKLTHTLDFEVASPAASAGGTSDVWKSGQLTSGTLAFEIANDADSFEAERESASNPRRDASPVPNPDARPSVGDEVGEPKVEDEGPRKLNKPTFILPDHLNVMAVGFTNDSKQLVSVATQRAVSVRTWNVEGRKLAREVELASDKHGNFFLFGKLQLSADGRQVAAIVSGQVGVWETATGALVKMLELPDELKHGVLGGLACTPDFSLIACGRTPGLGGISPPHAHAIVWDVDSGKVLQTVQHDDAIQIKSVALSHDGNWLATGGQQAGTCVWEVSTGKRLLALPNTNPDRKYPDPKVTDSIASQVLCLGFSHDRRQLAIGDMLGVKLVDAKSGRLLHQLDAPFRLGRSGLVFSKDSQLLARTATDKVVPIWSTRTGKLLVEIPTEAHDGAFSDDGRSFAVGFSDKENGLAVWQLRGESPSEPKSASAADKPPKDDAAPADADSDAQETSGSQVPGSSGSDPQNPSSDGIQARCPLLEFYFAANPADHKLEPRVPADFEQRRYPDNNAISRSIAKDRGFVWIEIAESENSKVKLPVERVRGGKQRIALLADTPEHAMRADGKWSIETCRVVPGPDGGGLFSIEMNLNEAGGKILRALTKSHRNQRLAIVVNGEIIAAPIVREAVGQAVVITGDFTREQAEKLSSALRAGIVQGNAGDLPGDPQPAIDVNLPTGDAADELSKRTPAPKNAGHEAVIPNGEIVGRLINASTGKPVQGATIACGAVINESKRGGGASTITDAQGRYRMPVPSPGIYNVWLKKFDQGAAMTAAADDGILVEPGKVAASQLQLVVGRKIVGKVVDADAKTYANAGVSSYSAARPFAGGVQSVKTKKDGSFEIFLPPGRAYLYVNPGIKVNPQGPRLSAREYINVSANGAIEPILLTLKKSNQEFGDPEWLDRSTPGTKIVRREGDRDVTGTVVDEFDKPIAGAKTFRHNGPIVLADKQGEFRVEVARGTQLVMHAFAPGFHVWTGAPTSGDVLKVVLEKKRQTGAGTKAEDAKPAAPRDKIGSSGLVPGAFGGLMQEMQIGPGGGISYSDAKGLCQMTLYDDHRLKVVFHNDHRIWTGVALPLVLGVGAQRRAIWSAEIDGNAFHATAIPFSNKGCLFRLEKRRDGKLVHGSLQFFAARIQPANAAPEKPAAPIYHPDWRVDQSGTGVIAGRYTGASQVMQIAEDGTISYRDQPHGICHLAVLEDDRLTVSFRDVRGAPAEVTLPLVTTAAEHRASWSAEVDGHTLRATAVPYSDTVYVFVLEKLIGDKLIEGEQQLYAIDQKLRPATTEEKALAARKPKWQGRLGDQVKLPDIIARFKSQEDTLKGCLVTAETKMKQRTGFAFDGPELEREFSTEFRFDDRGRIYSKQQGGVPGRSGTAEVRQQMQVGAFNGREVTILRGSEEFNWAYYGPNKFRIPREVDPRDYLYRYSNEPLSRRIAEKKYHIADVDQWRDEDVIVIESDPNVNVEKKTSYQSRLLVAPAFDYAVVVRTSRIRFDDIGPEWHEYSRQETFDYEQQQPTGLWFPKRGTYTSLNVTREQIGKKEAATIAWKKETTFTLWKPNPKFTDADFTLEIPAGIFVMREPIPPQQDDTPK